MSTQTEKAFKKIKADILIGQFKSGDKLNIEHLKRRYDIGLTPLREALNRLVSLGFVEFIGLKGFRVSPLSKEDLEDIYSVRQLIETKALKLAIEKGDETWESLILASYHRLYKLEHSKNFISKPDISEWMSRYHDFHFTLLNACESHWLLTLDKLLFEQSERYRFLRMVKAKYIEKLLKKKAKVHKKLIDHILSREKQKAIQLFSESLKDTVKDLMKLW